MTSTRYSTALKHSSYFQSLDMEGIMSLRSPECVQVMAPSSLGNRPPLTNDVYEPFIPRFKPIVSEFPVEIKEIVEDKKNNKVVIWATARAVWKDEAMDGENSDLDWDGEYIFILCTDETGEKLIRVVEFLDSKRTEVLRSLVARATKNLEKKG